MRLPKKKPAFIVNFTEIIINCAFTNKAMTFLLFLCFFFVCLLQQLLLLTDRFPGNRLVGVGVFLPVVSEQTETSER